MTPHSCPWPVKKLLDGNSLRQMGVDPYYFGLGFIQIKLDDTWRLHLWTPDWPTVPGAENEFHNHRYEFKSWVLMGGLSHELMALSSENKASDSRLELVEVSCKPGRSEDPVSLGSRSVIQVGNFKVSQGQHYSLGPNAFHRSFPSGPTVTLVQRGPIMAENALVLRHENSISECPFSIEKTTQECWDKIDEILGKPFTPGYHLRPITKGVLGETSKIQEELDELVEAQEQGVKIMAECELADLHGAIEAYVAKHFPHLTMEDLRHMAHVTRRAFESGRRT